MDKKNDPLRRRAKAKQESRRKKKRDRRQQYVDKICGQVAEKLKSFYSIVLGAGSYSPNIVLPFASFLKDYNEGFFSFEDRVILAILENIGTDSKYAVEFGAVDGITASTIRLFLNNGWNGLQMERKIRMIGPYYSEIKEEHTTAENINDLFQKYDVPCNLDVLSIDVDGNDYWIWNSLDAKYTPRVVIIECNCSFDWQESKAIRYDPAYRKSNEEFTNYWGATPMAMLRLGKSKGYSLLYIKNRNAYFVLSKLLHPADRDIPLEHLYKRDMHPYRTGRTNKQWVVI